jgi:hypothetical protein
MATSVLHKVAKLIAKIPLLIVFQKKEDMLISCFSSKSSSKPRPLAVEEKIAPE